MSCQHAENVCQHCLQKVQREEEEVSSPPPKRVVPRPAPKKSNTEKANEIFFGTSFLALAAYVAFWNVKFFLTTVDFAAFVAKDIFKNLVD